MNGQTRDYYEVLGVARQARAEEIKHAFRRRARELHPDVSSDPDAQDRFSELSRAYSVLSKPTARLLYDRFGYLGRGNGGFDRRQASRAGARGDRTATVEFAELAVYNFEALRGTTRKVDVAAVGICTVCDGTGAAPGSLVRSCARCGGDGRRRTRSERVPSRLLQIDRCPECEGTGRVLEEPCRECGGRGRTNAKRRVKVEIAPGSEDGKIIRLDADGGRDVYLVLRVLPDRDSGVLRLAAALALVVALALFLVALLAPDALVGV